MASRAVPRSVENRLPFKHLQVQISVQEWTAAWSRGRVVAGRSTLRGLRGHLVLPAISYMQSHRLHTRSSQYGRLVEWAAGW